MCSGSGRTFGEQQYRLVALKRFGDCNRLVLCALDVATPDVGRAILVGEPVDEAVAEIVLGNERAIGRSAEHQNIEPANVVGNEQSVIADWSAVKPDPGAGYPSGSG